MATFMQTTVGTYNNESLKALVKKDLADKGFPDAEVISNTPDVVITGTVSEPLTFPEG